MKTEIQIPQAGNKAARSSNIVQNNELVINIANTKDRVLFWDRLSNTIVGIQNKLRTVEAVDDNTPEIQKEVHEIGEKISQEVEKSNIFTKDEWVKLLFLEPSKLQPSDCDKIISGIPQYISYVESIMDNALRLQNMLNTRQFDSQTLESVKELLNYPAGVYLNIKEPEFTTFQRTYDIILTQVSLTLTAINEQVEQAAAMIPEQGGIASDALDINDFENTLLSIKSLKANLAKYSNFLAKIVTVGYVVQTENYPIIHLIPSALQKIATIEKSINTKIQQYEAKNGLPKDRSRNKQPTTLIKDSHVSITINYLPSPEYDRLWNAYDRAYTELANFKIDDPLTKESAKNVIALLEELEGHKRAIEEQANADHQQYVKLSEIDTAKYKELTSVLEKEAKEILNKELKPTDPSFTGLSSAPSIPAPAGSCATLATQVIKDFSPNLDSEQNHARQNAEYGTKALGKVVTANTSLIELPAVKALHAYLIGQAEENLDPSVAAKIDPEYKKNTLMPVVQKAMDKVYNEKLSKHEAYLDMIDSSSSFSLPNDETNALVDFMATSYQIDKCGANAALLRNFVTSQDLPNNHRIQMAHKTIHLMRAIKAANSDNTLKDSDIIQFCDELEQECFNIYLAKNQGAGELKKNQLKKIKKLLNIEEVEPQQESGKKKTGDGKKSTAKVGTLETNLNTYIKYAAEEYFYHVPPLKGLPTLKTEYGIVPEDNSKPGNSDRAKLSPIEIINRMSSGHWKNQRHGYRFDGQATETPEINLALLVPKDQLQNYHDSLKYLSSKGQEIAQLVDKNTKKVQELIEGKEEQTFYSSYLPRFLKKPKDPKNANYIKTILDGITEVIEEKKQLSEIAEVQRVLNTTLLPSDEDFEAFENAKSKDDLERMRLSAKVIQDKIGLNKHQRKNVISGTEGTIEDIDSDISIMQCNFNTCYDKIQDHIKGLSQTDPQLQPLVVGLLQAFQDLQTGTTLSDDDINALNGLSGALITASNLAIINDVNGGKEIQFVPGTLSYKDENGSFYSFNSHMPSRESLSILEAYNGYLHTNKKGQFPLPEAAGSHITFGLNHNIKNPDASNVHTTWLQQLYKIVAASIAKLLGADKTRDTAILSKELEQSLELISNYMTSYERIKKEINAFNEKYQKFQKWEKSLQSAERKANNSTKQPDQERVEIKKPENVPENLDKNENDPNAATQEQEELEKLQAEMKEVKNPKFKESLEAVVPQVQKMTENTKNDKDQAAAATKEQAELEKVRKQLEELREELNQKNQEIEDARGTERDKFQNQIQERDTKISELEARLIAKLDLQNLKPDEQKTIIDNIDLKNLTSEQKTRMLGSIEIKHLTPDQQKALVENETLLDTKFRTLTGYSSIRDLMATVKRFETGEVATELEQKKKELEQMKKDKESSDNEFKDKIADLKSQIQQLNADQGTLAKQKNKLEQETVQLQNSLKNATQETTIYQEENKALKEENTGLSAMVKARDAEMKNLEEALKTEQKKSADAIEEGRDGIAGQIKQRETLEQYIKEIQAKNEELQKQLEDTSLAKQEQATKETDAQSALERALNQAAQDKKTTESQMESIREACEFLQKQLQDEQNARTEDRKAYDADKQQWEKRNNELAQALQDAQAPAQNKESQPAQENSESIEELKKTIEELKKTIEELKKTIEELKKTIEELQTRAARNQTETKSKMNDLYHKNEKVVAENTSLKNRLNTDRLEKMEQGSETNKQITEKRKKTYQYDNWNDLDFNLAPVTCIDGEYIPLQKKQAQEKQDGSPTNTWAEKISVQKQQQNTEIGGGKF